MHFLHKEWQWGFWPQLWYNFHCRWKHQLVINWKGWKNNEQQTPGASKCGPIIINQTMTEQRAIGINGIRAPCNVGNAWHFIQKLLLANKLNDNSCNCPMVVTQFKREICFFWPVTPLSYQNVSKHGTKMWKNDLLAWGVCLTFHRLALYLTSVSSQIIDWMLCITTLHVDKNLSIHLPVSHCSVLSTLLQRPKNNFENTVMYYILLERCFHRGAQRSAQLLKVMWPCYIIYSHLNHIVSLSYLRWRNIRVEDGKIDLWDI